MDTASAHATNEVERIEQFLAEASTGGRDAWARLLRIIYGDLRRLAHHQLQRGMTVPTLDTTSLVSEWYLQVCESNGAVPTDRRHFFALASTIMRRVLCGYARQRLTVKRGAGQVRVELDAAEREAMDEADRLVAIDQALERLSNEDPDLVRVVECRYFAGMTESETAEAMNWSLRSVQRAWADARQRLALALGA